jgi:hypothetical protein
MERLGALISKLKEQYEEHAGLPAIAITAQMILAELQQQNNAAAGNDRYKKVSVIMPSVAREIKAEKEEEIIVIKEQMLPKPEPVSVKHEPVWMVNTKIEAPTLVEPKKQVFELNETMGTNGENSINEKLREEKTELGNTLHDTPVKDLKKAIGINDRYLFINELFRGDETRYERSIKTINSFNILPEAEFWIRRELKVKFGWNEKSEAVALFDQLVKRRFS